MQILNPDRKNADSYSLKTKYEVIIKSMKVFKPQDENKV